MPISSNTLFHFTSVRETLESILKSKYLWPQFCTEYYWGKYRFALPMSCLCDIPLSEMMVHIKHYGKFGIGLSKEWAKNIKELSTVIYTRHNSLIYKHVCSILNNIDIGQKLSKEDMFILSRVKKYSGNAYCCPNSKRKLIRNVRFYNEREWRYVPEKLSSNDIFVEKNQDIKPIKGNNEVTKGDPKFEYNDIKYLIVKNDSDRIKLIDFIENNLGTELNINGRALLKSKILTTQQIKEDF